MAVFAGVLVAYRLRWIRVTRRRSGFVTASAAGMILLMVSDVLLCPVIGADGLGFHNAGLGVCAGVAGIALAAPFLALHFKQVEDGVTHGAPREDAWLAAFGLTLTLVCLYVETVRLLTLVPEDDVDCPAVSVIRRTAPHTGPCTAAASAAVAAVTTRSSLMSSQARPTYPPGWIGTARTPVHSGRSSARVPTYSTACGDGHGEPHTGFVPCWGQKGFPPSGQVRVAGVGLPHLPGRCPADEATRVRVAAVRPLPAGLRLHPFRRPRLPRASLLSDRSKNLVDV
ncbi:Bax inhibitor-1/YccA family protein [Streptomyces sp. NPDC001792]|uniref:Bax inhibitor-1/YccA family membrane protein n=1 Tax=Streptomyces sp. NPDC001792 TaxID=3154524 RepID=UPI00332382B8